MSEYYQPQGDQTPGMPPAPPAQPYYPVGAPVPRTNTLAIVSLISSFFLNVVGIITGHIALRQIKRTGEAGRGMALAGTIIGYVSLAMTFLAGILLVLSLFFGLAIFGTIFAAASQSGPIPNLPEPTAIEQPMPDAVGVVGAVDFDEGYISVGSGPAAIDYFFDPMCPYCALFEETNSASLNQQITSDLATVRLHPLTFLDPQSQGTDYSSRAASAVTCVAALDEDSLTLYLTTLFAEQPAEGTEGLSSDELAALMSDSLDTSTQACIAQDSYVDWVQTVTDNALSGVTSEKLGLPSVTGTPAVFRDGTQYTGPLDDSLAFDEFLAGK